MTVTYHSKFVCYTCGAKEYNDFKKILWLAEQHDKQGHTFYAEIIAGNS